MRNLLYFYVLLLLFLTSCRSKDPQPDQPSQEENNEPAVDKNAFIAPLMVPGRYWRFEEIRIKTGDSTRNIGFYPISGAMDYMVATSIIPYSSFHFDSLVVAEELGGGPYGNRAYPAAFRMEISTLGNTYDGTWKWNDERETVEMQLPYTMSVVIGSVSRSKFSPKTGYLDNKVVPRFVTLVEAQNGTAPERISVVVEEDDPFLGKIQYSLILRSAWLIEVAGGTPKVPSYRVHY